MNCVHGIDLENTCGLCEPPKLPRERAKATPAMMWATLIFLMAMCAAGSYGVYDIIRTIAN